jgi:copper chaperone CopZ
VKNRVLLTISLSLVCLFLVAGPALAGQGCPVSQKASAKATTDATPASVTTEDGSIVLNVSNMTCGSCVNHVTKTLTAVDGVGDVKVSLEKGIAEVKYDVNKVKSADLTAAVVKAGYPTSVATLAGMTNLKVPGCDPKACGTKKGCDPKACGMKKTAGASGCGMKSAAAKTIKADEKTGDK